MRILWGALRAVSVEMLGVLVVLWMLHGATGLALDAPWRTTKSPEPANEPNDVTATRMPWTSSVAAAIAPTGVPEETNRVETQRATMSQWFNTLFPASLDKGAEPAEIDQRTEFARERLDHYSRLYGIASRD